MFTTYFLHLHVPIAGIGLIGLGIYQFSTGDVNAGVQSMLAAAAALGLQYKPTPVAAPVK